MIKEWSSGHIKAVPLSWSVGRVIYGEKFGHGFFAHEPGTVRKMASEELPIEFWNHQLTAVDTESIDSVLSFVEQFGFPFSPWRNGVVGDYVHKYSSVFGSTVDAMGVTQNLMENDCIGMLVDQRTGKDAAISPVISCDEAILTIREFQQCISNLYHAIRDNSIFVFASFLNIGACNPMTATNANLEAIDRSGEDLHSVGLLSAAICNQIIDSIADEALWRECASETCDRIFKRKQGLKNPHTRSNYCCKTCADAQRQRNQRAAAKNRIQH